MYLTTITRIQKKSQISRDKCLYVMLEVFHFWPTLLPQKSKTNLYLRHKKTKYNGYTISLNA